MQNRELREWLGITPADLLAYVGIAAIVAMFFVSNPTALIALAVLGLAFAIAACPLGMKADPAVSKFTNVVKLVSYPAVVVALLAAIYYRYFLYAA